MEISVNLVIKIEVYPIISFLKRLITVLENSIIHPLYMNE